MYGSYDNADRRLSLVQFLYDTVDLVGRLSLKQSDAHGRLFPDELDGPIKDAWREFSGEFDARTAEERILATLEDRLYASGLGGSSLDLELAVIERLHRRWQDQGGVDALVRLLEAVDSLLAVLVEAVGLDPGLRTLA